MRAAYEDIADWHENEFLRLQRSDSLSHEFADGLSIDHALVEMLGTGEELRLEVGYGAGIYAGDLNLADLLNLLPASGQVFERFAEGYEPTPITLLIQARA